MDDEFDHFLGKPSDISGQMTKSTNSQVGAARSDVASARLIYNQLSDVAMVCEYDAVVVCKPQLTCPLQFSNRIPCMASPLVDA